MRYNCFFDTYRRTDDLEDADKRIYSSAKTVTSGVGAIGTVAGDLRAILGLDAAVVAYYLMIEAYDVVIGDKVVITAPGEFADDYYIDSIEQVPVGLLTYKRIIIRRDG